MEESSSNNSSKKPQQQSIILSKECAICGGPAIYSYFGVISCQPCKVFFRRNAERRREILKCDFDGQCEINVNNRHVCSYCRLVKCFSNGMKIELIRSSRGISNTRSLVRSNQPVQFPTLNLLRSDQSTLTLEQWNIISNLSHCYDEHSGLSIGERFMNEQNLLPPKIRYKSTAVMELFQTLLSESQFIYKNNQDFLSLPSDDRSILLHTTFRHATSLSTNFILYKVRLMDHPSYFDIIEMISHSNAASAVQRIKYRLGFDMIIFKLLLAIISFSTINYTVYSNTPPINLSNIKQILRIQDTYIELTWRYLIYKHNYEQAIKCFSDLLRCLFAVTETIVKSDDVQWYVDIVDELVQQTEQSFVVKD